MPSARIERGNLRAAFVKFQAVNIVLEHCTTAAGALRFLFHSQADKQWQGNTRK
jgi:hypothetical protein